MDTFALLYLAYFFALALALLLLAGVTLIQWIRRKN